jgi:hypothetical protein
MNVVCIYVYIHYHLNECRLERTIFWDEDRINYMHITPVP